MTKEFNLSEKIWKVVSDPSSSNYDLDVADLKDIKEFIKRERELINKLILGRIREEDFWRERGKLAGPKLI